MKQSRLLTVVVFLLVTMCFGATQADITPGVVQSTRAATVIVQVREKDEKDFSSNGTGWFYESKNLVVTAKHVVTDSTSECKVITFDGQTIEVAAVKVSQDADVALLQLKNEPKSKVKPIILAKKPAEFGETIYTIGHPFMQFQFQLSVGRVTGDGFTADTFLTSTTLIPGNSGGVFCNVKGEAVGLAVATFEGTETINVGVNLSTLKKSLEKLKSDK